MHKNNHNLVGIFDSGIGGLSVLREIRSMLPFQPLIYIADQAHVPYGKRSLEQIKTYSFAITRFLINQGARLIVVACNTASAVALKDLREAHPHLPFVGMEPAVKPGVEKTATKVVGVLATPATFQGKLYHTLVERFAGDVTLLKDTCPGLVEAIEHGDWNSPQTKTILKRALLPMLEKQADTIILGCTHFPFAIPAIREIVGPDIRIIDPAPAIARRVTYLLSQDNTIVQGSAQPSIHFCTSGDPDRLKNILYKLLQVDTRPIPLVWEENRIAYPKRERGAA